MAWSKCSTDFFEAWVPVGLFGLATKTAFVRGVIAAAVPNEDSAFGSDDDIPF